MPQTVSGGSAPGGSRPTDSATLHPGLRRRAEARFPRYSPYLYTRSPSPVQTAVFPPLCTPEGLLLYELPPFPHSVHQKAFSCTNFCLSPTLYTTGPSPVRTAVFPPLCTPQALLLYELPSFPHFVHHRPSPVRTSVFPPLCTPQALLLYELLSFPHSVHQKAFSCTNCR